MGNPIAGSLVFTGPTGPGNSVSALSLTNLKRIEFDFIAHTVKTIDLNEQVKTFDIHATTTFTAAVTAGVSIAETLSQ